MPKENNILTTVILSSAVVAALITSLTNLIVSLINNRRLKNIEEQRKMSEIDKYRYTHLYEMLLNWHNYDSAPQGKNAGEIAFHRLLNAFLDNVGRFDIIRPLLDEQFIGELDKLKEKGNELLANLIENEKPDGTHTEEFSVIKDQYFEVGTIFSNKLNETINQQLKILLMK